MPVSVQGVEDVNRMLAEMANLRVALLYAKNELIQAVWEGEKVEAMMSLDNPKPFTIKQILFDKKETVDQLGRVWLRDPFDQDGANERSYLGVNILSGTRTRPKGSELAMRAMGYMRDDQVWVPDKNARLDANGNIPGNTIQNMVNEFRWYGTKPMLGREFFLMGGVNVPPMGVYRYYNGKWRPFIWFVSPIEYATKYDFYARADADVAYHWPRIYEAAMDRQLDQWR